MITAVLSTKFYLTLAVKARAWHDMIHRWQWVSYGHRMVFGKSGRFRIIWLEKLRTKENMFRFWCVFVCLRGGAGGARVLRFLWVENEQRFTFETRSEDVDVGITLFWQILWCCWKEWVLGYDGCLHLTSSYLNQGYGRLSLNYIYDQPNNSQILNMLIRLEERFCESQFNHLNSIIWSNSK